MMYTGDVCAARWGMHRTQIYLTDVQRRALQSIARRLGRTQSDLIRSALDTYIEWQTPAERIELLRAGRGLWKGRGDLSELAAVRSELDRPDR